GVSAAGVWITDDGGQTWRTGYAGLVPEYMPEEAREGTNVLCVHNMHRAPTRPERLFMQFHGNVYRSDDEGSSWNEIRAGLPSGFGFPLVIDPADADSAFVIPLVADIDRVTPDAEVRVYETRDAGTSWTAHGDGLPRNEAYLTVLRQAFGAAGEGAGMQLYFGATSGDVFGSPDAGASWFQVHERLAPVTSVRVA
ncbi:MAG: WD40/YVTN/BNR-like repeat-containing protein, partial [Microbacterium sp.]